MFSPGYYYAVSFLKRIDYLEKSPSAEESLIAQVIFEETGLEKDPVAKLRELKTIAKQRIAEERKQNAIVMHRRGESMRSIARRMGVADSTVRGYLKNA